MIPAVTTDNKNITEQIAFIHHAITEQSHNVHSTTRLITAEIVAEIRIFVFVFISFIFCLFQKKRHGGYANIISSLSLRLAAVPLWLLNSACRDCSLLVVNSNDILNILLVRVGRGTYVRTVNMNLRYPSEVLIAVCYHLLLEVVDTFSHDVNFVVLNFVNKISFHVVFVFSCYCFVFYLRCKGTAFF